MMITMMMINKEAPTTDPTMTSTGIPAGNTNAKEKVKRHAILFIDLGGVFMWIDSKINEAGMVIREHMSPTEQTPGHIQHSQKIEVQPDWCNNVQPPQPARGSS